MFRSRMFKFVAVVGALAGALAATDSVEARGLRHRCCAVVCRPVPCPVVVYQPVRVIAVPMAVGPQVRVMPSPVRPVTVYRGGRPLPMPPQNYCAPGTGGPRVFVITIKVPKRKPRPVAVPPVYPQPVIPAPMVCAPVICCPAPIICCPAPIICPPICIPRRCCPIRNCR